MSTKNSQRGITIWVILLLVLLLAACVPVISSEISQATRPPERSQPTQVPQGQGVSLPEGIPEDKIDLGTIVACEANPEYRLFGFTDFGVQIDYLENWYMTYYRPGERIGSGGGPEYIAVFTNVPGNFDPAYSEGTGQYDDQLGVVQIFVYRDPLNGQDIFENQGIDPNSPNVQVFESNYGLSGFLYYEEPQGDDFWISLKAVYDFGDYAVTVEATLWNAKGSPQTMENCGGIVSRILLSVVPFTY